MTDIEDFLTIYGHSDNLLNNKYIYDEAQKADIFNNYSTRARWISNVIIQQIVTMPIYGREVLNICHPYMTDILRYT